MRRMRVLGLCLVVGLATGAVTAAAASATSHGATAWGSNSSWTLGDGTDVKAEVPSTVSDLGEVMAVSAGGEHSLALLSNGEVMAWGAGYEGQLGDGTEERSDEPVKVSKLSEVTAISAGGRFSLALLSNGEVMAWGANHCGELGDGTTSDSDKPVAVKGLKDVTAISAGYNYGMALLENGTVMAWGCNESGQLGDGTTTNSEEPVEVKGLTEVAAISSGARTSLALVKGGTVMAWGSNEHGQLGDNTSKGPETCLEYVIEAEEGEEILKEYGCSVTPVKVSELSEVTSVSAGSGFSLALLSNGEVRAWGVDGSGQLGNGETTAEHDLPVKVSGLKEVAAISAGTNHGLALLKDGTAMAWGSNEDGQLGDGTTTSSDKPVEVGLSEVAGVSAGEDYSLAYGPPGPTVEEMKPARGPIGGGTSVEVIGTDFTGATAVHFGSATATGVKVESSTKITATSPAGTRTVAVTVTTPFGTSAGSADEFMYVPEVGRCDGVVKGTGKYKTGACDSLLTGGSFEWFPGLVDKGFTTSGGTTTVETVGKAKVVCTAESGTGEYSGTIKAVNVFITLSGCELSGAKCSTAGAKEGEIATDSLQGELGLSDGETHRAVFELSPAAAGPFAEFSCGGYSVVWRGSVLVPVTEDKMLLTTTLKYSATKGIQAPEGLEEGPLDVLESSIAGKAFEQAGLTTTLTQTNEEQVEVNTFV